MPQKLITRVFFVIAMLSLGACATTPAFEGTVEEQIDQIFADHQSKPGYEAFRSKLLQAWYQYEDYKPLGPKAMAISTDVAGRFVYGWGYGSTSVTVGMQFAKDFCNRRREEVALDRHCVIFAKQDRIVLESF